MTAEADGDWVFAYGSLMWNPGFCHTEAVRATLTGYHRAFCIYSIHYRGSERRPGLVLGLDHGGTCEGVAYRLPRDDTHGCLDYLRRRELIYAVYREASVPLTLSTHDHRRVLATTFIAEPAHPAYAGRLALAEQARLIRGAAGAAGTNLDYLINTLEHLAELGICERRQERLLTACGPLAASGSGSGPARSAARSLARCWGRTGPQHRPLRRGTQFSFRRAIVAAKSGEAGA